MVAHSVGRGFAYKHGVDTHPGIKHCGGHGAVAYACGGVAVGRERDVERQFTDIDCFVHMRWF